LGPLFKGERGRVEVGFFLNLMSNQIQYPLRFF
jgi:hypothetical protein